MGQKELTARADWMSLGELLELTQWDRSTVHRKQASRQIRTRPVARAGNGKAIREYDASSLPAEFQAKRLQQRISSAPIVLVKSSTHPAASKVPKLESDQSACALAAFSPEERAQAEMR